MAEEAGNERGGPGTRGRSAESAEYSPMAKILVVDDQPNIVRLLQYTLEREHEVLTASNGAEAMEVIARERPDVMVLDVVMPVLDGSRVLHRVKSNPDTRGITVILLTVKNQPDDVMLGFTVGADYYVPKPFNSADVAALIRRHLGAETGGGGPGSSAEGPAPA